MIVRTKILSILHFRLVLIGFQYLVFLKLLACLFTFYFYLVLLKLYKRFMLAEMKWRADLNLTVIVSTHDMKYPLLAELGFDTILQGVISNTTQEGRIQNVICSLVFYLFYFKILCLFSNGTLAAIKISRWIMLE